MTKPTFISRKSNGVTIDPRYRKRLQPKVVTDNATLFRSGGDFIPANITPGKYAFIESLREATMAEDWARLFEIWPVEKWGNIPLGKFRFVWGPDGKPRYKTFTRAGMESYFRGPWLSIDKDWGEVCPEDFINKYTHDYYSRHVSNSRKQPETHPHHNFRMYPTTLKCKAKQGSKWVQYRKYAAVGAGIAGAIFLGPAIAAKVGSIGAGGSGVASGVAPGVAAGAGAASGSAVAATAVSTAAKTSILSKIATGSAGMLNWVNKGRTIKAIAEGKLPPPPIELSGAAFRQYAFEAAQDEMAKSLQRKLTRAEENKLRQEIAAMQRQLEAATPRHIPPQPSPDLAPTITRIQTVEENRKDAMDKYLLPAALVVGAILLGG